MERPDDVRSSQKSPIDTAGPRDDTSRPTISVTSPTQGSSSIEAVSVISSCNMLSIQLVDQSAFNFSQLRFYRSVQNALRGLEKDFAGFQTGIRRHYEILRRPALLQRLADQAFERRMQAHAVYLTGLYFRESGFHQARKCVGIDGDFAVNHASGDRDGKMDQILGGLVADNFFQPRELRESLRKTFHRRTNLFFGLLPAGRRAFYKRLAAQLV